LHGVVFDIFGWEPPRRGLAARILPEAAHASEAFAVPKWRAPQIRPFLAKALASS